MKAVSLIKHLGLFGTKPVVKISKCGHQLYSVQIRENDLNHELERLEDYCKENNFTVTTFTVANDTLTVNVV